MYSSRSVSIPTYFILFAFLLMMKTSEHMRNRENYISSVNFFDEE